MKKKLFAIENINREKTYTKNNVFVNAFTLIELLGVLAILGIIGLITYPIVNKSINNSRQNALEEIIKNIEHAAYLYSLDNSLEISSSYNNLDVNLLKEAGILEDRDIINPVTEEEMDGCLIYRWEAEQYEFKYIYPCQQSPTIAVSNKDGVFNEKGWSTNSFYVDIKGNGTSYSYCISDKECTPNTEVENSSGNVYINTNGSYYVCAYAINELGVSETKCEQFNLDTNAPVITNIVYFDKGDNKLTDLLDVTSVSGYKASCNKKYVNDLIIGDNTVNCTITSNNGLSTTQNILFKPNVLKVARYDETTFLSKGTILKTNVESIKLLDYIEIPEDKKEVVDVSDAQNRSIMAWYMDEDKNGMYELYIGQNGGIISNPNASNLFYGFTNVANIDVRKLDTSNVTSMCYMFKGLNKVTELDLSNFDTSQVTEIYAMFYDCRSLTELNISSFNTGKVTKMWAMFYNCSSLEELDISNFDTSNVIMMSDMFNGMINLESLDVSDFDTSKVNTMSFMFYNCSSLVFLNVSNFDTSQVTNMSYMFYNCSKLTELDVSGFDTSNVTNMETMFYATSKLQSLDVSNFNTSNVTNMHAMFNGLASVTTLDLSNFNTSQVTNMKTMFANTFNLTNLDISNFNVDKVTDGENMFYAIKDNPTITINNNIKTFIEARLTEVGKTANLIVNS